MYRIILVSESESFVKTLGIKLSEIGYSWLSFDEMKSDEHIHGSFIVILDIQSFQMTFHELGEFLKEYPYPVLVMSAIPTFEEGYPLLRMGVRGYANRHIGSVHLQSALSVLESGGSWFDPGFMNDLIRHIDYRGTPSESGQESFEILSEREREIARYIAQGLSNHQIAEVLEITERTVKAHLLSCYKKLGLNDRVSLALWVKEAGYV
ncbi:MAG: response regulator transcription factor [Sulfuricurvum sp.]|uniref:response regulator transcription factor n=1 Tax=Sulfuricurvum sp. TaxID=2025608 RepID=UPI002732559A|nr:response regulator transcription factor [Sulfuricurvum sp.]MDP3290952.1 response regulator transcription factor [Sulfuricurvum sp.]